MFDFNLNNNTYVVKFYYEKPMLNAKGRMTINTHCEIILKGEKKEDNKVIASANKEVLSKYFVHSVSRKLALTKAINKFSNALNLTKENRADIWSKYLVLTKAI